jgi:hypothetical protein
LCSPSSHLLMQLETTPAATDKTNDKIVFKLLTSSLYKIEWKQGSNFRIT